jgi:hypothetical protein
MVRTTTFMLAASALAFTAVPALAQEGTPSRDNTFVTFTPSDTPNKDKIDYSIWDEAMKNLVISMGPSLRQTAGTPQPSFGTRRIYGHRSRFRLEGSRIMFSFLDNDIRASFTEYRQDLERTADIVDIQALSRNEQLAFWINLHNVAMIEQIANAWPVRQPRTIEIDGVPLDEARFITVEGVALSPRDIREKIVFANWDDAKVMYGFWRGEIGGPSIQREAYNADNVARLLDRGARDFVNSLRGSQKRGSTLEVSEMFEEAAPFFFPDFNKDVRAHMAIYANEDTQDLLTKTSALEANVKEYDIADLAGGLREPTYQNITSDGNQVGGRIPQSMARLLQQREEKFDRIIRNGRTGTVTFSNIDLPGDEDGEVQ